ncbi:MAG: hypothetical protein M1399_07595 [Actinobacteria bacterium]|nr:hypothetical protein [Actinomycetota bacterium]MCL5447043.1 hypothetical protein [Actinomycetota bacterium]
MNGMRQQQGPMGRMGPMAGGQRRGDGSCGCGPHGHGPGYGPESGCGHGSHSRHDAEERIETTGTRTESKPYNDHSRDSGEGTEEAVVSEREAEGWRGPGGCGCGCHERGHGYQQSDRQSGEPVRRHSREDLEAYRRDLEEELADVSSRISKMG